MATVDGGTTYWHPRPTGEDAGAMVLDELLPRLQEQGLRTDRLAFQGWSMGGYGTLRLGGAPRRVAGPGRRGAQRSALDNPADASLSGFADAAEYLRYSVLGRQAQLRGVQVRVDCGTDDPFYAADRAYVAGFDRPVTSTFQPGAHTTEYWTRMMPAVLAFVGTALSSGLSSGP